MAQNRKNRFFFINEDEDDNKDLKHNRISRIESHGKKYLPFIIIFSAVAVAIISILIIVNFYYKEPRIFSPRETSITPSDLQEKIVPSVESKNINIEKGKESYSKGFYNNAISFFNEVIEAGSSDQDKAMALTYIGIIQDDRGNYNSAIEYLLRALKYDKLNTITYRNLAISYRHKGDYESAIKVTRKGLDIDPDNVSNRILLGNILYDTGNYKDAIFEYEKALQANPDEATALHNLALALFKTGDENSGIEYLKRAGAADSLGNIAHLAYSKLGVLFLDRNDFELAEKYLKMAVSVKPDDPVVRYNLGITYLKTGQSEKAFLAFKKAEEQGKSDNNLLENLGETYFNLNDYERSIKVYNRLLESNRRNVKVLSRLAEIFHEKGDSEKALDLYKRITILEPATENGRIAYANIGNILDDMGRSEEAIETYKKALTLGKDDGSTHFNLGIAYKNAGKTELAIQSWRKASELNPDNPKPALAIASVYEEKQLFDLAVEEYQRIIRHWDNLQEAHFNLASLYYKKNLINYSVEEYKRVIDLNNNNDIARKAYVNLADILSREGAGKVELLEEAQSYAQKALLQKPNDAEALISLGLIYSRKGLVDKAIDTFYLAISSTRDSRIIAEAYNNIGKSYHMNGEYKNALKAFTQGIEEDPTMEELRINRKVSMQAYEGELNKK